MNDTCSALIVAPLAIRSDRGRVAEILRSTENFRDEEIDVALELFDESFAGEDYVFVGAFSGTEGTGTGNGATSFDLPEPRFPVPRSRFPRLVGFACYRSDDGHRSNLRSLLDRRRSRCSGHRVWFRVALHEVERRLEALHARMLVVETSSRSDYTATRGFYLERGYVEAARVREFYAPEDDRIILTKRLAGSPRQGWGAVA